MAHVEARTFHLEQILAQVSEGILRVPRFQRRFVWSRKQIIEFLDSLRLRYPVGSLLVWRTTERYASFDRVGPVAVPPNQPAPPAEVGYVLDGHQRLSVIFGIFALSDEEAASLNGPDRAFLVYFDLDDERFVHVRYPEEHHLPIRLLFGMGDDLTSWLDERRDATEPNSKERERWNTLRRRATQLQTTLAQYQLPYIDVTRATLEDALAIFVRVNTQGTHASREEIFSALAWRPDGFDFASAARDLLDQHPRYRNFGTKPVLQSILAALGEGIYDSAYETVLGNHQEELQGAMESIQDALGLALSFLGEHFGASSGRVVPYSLHVVFLTEFFRLRPDPSPEHVEQLRRWLWATSFATAYTSAHETEVDETMKRIRSLAHGSQVDLLPEDLTLRPFPRHFHAKAARVRVFHLFLKTMEPRDLRMGERLPTDLLTNGMADARTVAPSGSPLARRLAGRLLVGAGCRSPLKELEALAEPTLFGSNRSEVLQSHCISNDAYDALLRGEIETFIDLRERDLIRAERAFASQFVALGDRDTEEEAEIDVEEPPESDL